MVTLFKVSYRLALAGLLLCLASIALSQRAPREELMVAVAANAEPAMQKIAAEFEKETSATITFSAGATGMLARQVREGAPFDLFVSADMATPQKLAADGFVTTTSVAAYARGQLILWQPPQSQPRLSDINDLRSTTTAHFRIAVANPETAPYGAAAVQALKKTGAYDEVSARLVFSDNVAQALQFAASGNADCAFVPLSLILGKEAQGLTVPLTLHEPIIQGMGLVSASKKPMAESFWKFILSEKSAAILEKSGYVKP